MNKHDLTYCCVEHTPPGFDYLFWQPHHEDSISFIENITKQSDGKFLARYRHGLRCSICGHSVFNFDVERVEKVTDGYSLDIHWFCSDYCKAGFNG